MRSSALKIVSAILCLALCITCFCTIPAVADAPVNVLAGKIATCTAGRATGTLSNLTDGKYKYRNGNADCTYAHVTYGPGGGTTLADHSAYFEYSFDDAVRLNSVKLYNCDVERGQRARDIAIDVQLEDGTWQRVAADYKIAFDWPNAGGTYYEDSPVTYIYMQYKFAPVDCLKLRITANRKRMRERSENAGIASNACVFRLAEIQAFYDPSITTYSGVERPDQADYAVPMPALTNYALGGTVASKGDVNGTNRFSHLTDGDKSNRAMSFYYNGTTTPTDAQCVNSYDITFAAEREIDRVDVIYSKYATDDKGHREQDIAVDIIKSDGGYVRVAEKHNFTEAATAANGSNYTLELTFDPVEAIGVRISANCKQTTRYTTGGYSNIFQCYAEIEVYNDPNVVSNTGVNAATVSGTAIPAYSSSPIFADHQLLLGSQIGVVFKLNLDSLSSALKSSSYMEFTVNGETERVDFSNDLLSDGTYNFKCYVSAGQMAETINASYHYGGFTMLDDYSVKEYATWAKDNLSAGTALSLVNAMSDYGYFATKYLNALHGNTYKEPDTPDTVDSYSSDQISDKLSALTTLGVTTVREKNKNTDIASISYKLSLDTETTLKVFINLKAGYTGTFSASATDEGSAGYAAQKYSSGKYVIEIRGLKVQDLNKKISITGTTDAGEFSVSNLSVLTYVRTALKTTGDSNQNLKNAMAGLYDYYTSALAYIG